MAGIPRANALKTGHIAGLADAWIAAMAPTRGLTIVTRDIGDFAKLGVPTRNPQQG
jgi:predicted nucleic acid-binding protein